MNKKIKIFLSFIFIIAFSYIYASIRVTKTISAEDKELTKLLKVDDECSTVNSYQQEIKCIKSVQESQLSIIKGTRCRGKFINLGSKEVFKVNTACCYDRSRITEQVLQIFGFKVRHVFLNDASNGYLNLLIPRTRSHGASEVLTSKGWLGVDSNEKFLLLDKENLPNTYKTAISSGLIYKYSNKPIYNKSVTYVIGLYSRNGTFFKPYLPFVPELNFNDFFGNLFDLKIINPGINIDYI
tara:strand:+ start:91 stop:810 length:720 start_codon:yes stop_codon:yes gene_type:complete